MPIRFYVDADLLALGKALVAARFDVTYPGDLGDRRRERPPCPITDPGTHDRVWIPEVAHRGWVGISRDAGITKKPGELALVREHALRLAVLDTRHDRTTWGELRIAAAQWDHLEALTATAGPAVVILTRTSMRPLPI